MLKLKKEFVLCYRYRFFLNCHKLPNEKLPPVFLSLMVHMSKELPFSLEEQVDLGSDKNNRCWRAMWLNHSSWGQKSAEKLRKDPICFNRVSASPVQMACKPLWLHWTFTSFAELPQVRAENVGMAGFHFAGSRRQLLPLEGLVVPSAPLPGTREGCGAVVSQGCQGKAETRNRVQCSWTLRKCLMLRHVLCQSNT